MFYRSSDDIPRKLYRAHSIKYGQVIIKEAPKGKRSQNELKILKNLNVKTNDFVIDLYDSAETERKIYIVEEAGIPLELFTREKVDCNVMIRIWRATLFIMQYLHSEGILHTDIHIGNFVIVKKTANGKEILVLKLIDFEIANMSRSKEEVNAEWDIHDAADHLMHDILKKHESVARLRTGQINCSKDTIDIVKRVIKVCRGADGKSCPSLQELMTKDVYQINEENSAREPGFPHNFIDYYDIKSWKRMQTVIRSANVD